MRSQCPCAIVDEEGLDWTGLGSRLYMQDTVFPLSLDIEQ